MTAKDCSPVSSPTSDTANETATDATMLDIERQSPQESATAQQQQPLLPPLSSSEFRLYNRMAEMMEQYHNHFRSMWTMMIEALRTGKRKVPLKQFLQTGLDFCNQLATHHAIEEQIIFPFLAKKMPAFQNSNMMRSQHAQIHAGLMEFQKYVQDARDKVIDFYGKDMLQLMESFEEVLWDHLDQEVKQLSADNMRRYWSLEEMRRMPV